jgi:uncharacterized membrane protein
MIVSGVITVLCGVGLYASLFMLGKARLAERGLLPEPSVVQTPRARLFGGMPNALIGGCYYPALAIATWLPLPQSLEIVVLAMVVAAAATSLYLAYSLLFVTRRSCPYCWTTHAINWLLVWLFALHIWH